MKASCKVHLKRSIELALAFVLGIQADNRLPWSLQHRQRGKRSDEMSFLHIHCNNFHRDMIANVHSNAINLRGGATTERKESAEPSEEPSSPPVPRQLEQRLAASQKGRKNQIVPKAIQVPKAVAREVPLPPSEGFPELLSPQHQQQKQEDAPTPSFTLVPNNNAKNIAAASQIAWMLPIGSKFVWTLLGTSIVWHLFFYLLSVGYAIGIGLPVLVGAMQIMQRRQRVPLHAVLVILWSLRLSGFHLWRENVAWPAWGLRMRQVATNQAAQQTTGQRLIVTSGAWLVYSVVYFCMALPALWRLQRHETYAPSVTVGLQLLGLVISSLADAQKAQFKLRQQKQQDHGSHHRWCHLGLWKFSTHPNYVGEWLFWLGTVAGGYIRPRPGYRWQDTRRILAMLIGFGFISSVLDGAVQTLDKAQQRKYGNDPAFLEFTANYGVFGPRIHVWKQLLVSLTYRKSLAKSLSGAQIIENVETIAINRNDDTSSSSTAPPPPQDQTVLDDSQNSV